MYWQLYSHGRKLADGHVGTAEDAFRHFPRERWVHSGQLGDEHKYASDADPLRVIYIRPTKYQR